MAVLVFKGGSLTISSISNAGPSASGTHTYNPERVEYSRSASKVSWTGIDGVTVSEPGSETWELAITYLQDWSEADSLAGLLFEYEGETATVAYTLHAGGDTFTSEVTLEPGNIGSDGTSVATSSVSLSSTKPVRS